MFDALVPGQAAAGHRHHEVDDHLCNVIDQYNQTLLTTQDHLLWRYHDDGSDQDGDLHVLPEEGARQIATRLAEGHGLETKRKCSSRSWSDSTAERYRSAEVLRFVDEQLEAFTARRQRI